VCVDQNTAQTNPDAGNEQTGDTGVNQSTDTGMMMTNPDTGMMMMNPDTGMMMMNPDTGMMMTNPDTGMMMTNPDTGMMMGPADTGVVVDSGPAPCNPPMAVCGPQNDCVDLGSDPQHCGACDDSCRGGQCLQGECLPHTYYSASSNTGVGVIRVHTDAQTLTKSLVWSLEGTSGQIKMREAANTTSFPTTISGSVRRPQDISVDANNIWFSNTDDDTTKAGHVYVRPLPYSTGSPVQNLSAAQNVTSRQVYSISNHNGAIYWYTVSGFRVRSISNNGQFEDYQAPSGQSSYSHFLVATVDGLFWQNGYQGALFNHNLTLNDGSSPRAMGQVGVQARPGLVVRNTNAFYWAEDVDQCQQNTVCHIYEYILNQGAVNPIVTFQPGRGAMGLYVDATHLYYTRGDSNGRNGGVARISLAPNSNEETLETVSGSIALKGVAAVDNFVFWAENRNSESLIRMIRIP
jgi:hypothetical protein